MVSFPLQLMEPLLTSANKWLTTRMKSERDWLVSVDCVAHRSELSLKDSLLKVKEFKKLDDLMISLYNLHKWSGKLSDQ